MKKVLWLLPILGSMMGMAIGFFTMTGSTSAPQEAAGYAMACAFAVIPYVFARSVMAMADSGESGTLDRIADALEKANEVKR